MIFWGNKPGLLFSAALFLIISLSINRGYAEQTAGEGTFAPRIGYTYNTIVEVNIKDAQALAGSLTDYIAGKNGGKTETRICTSLNRAESDLKSSELDLIVLVANEFLKLKNRALLDPLFVAATDNDIYEQLVLIARNDSGFRTIKDLKGMVFVKGRGQFDEMKNIWLETLVLKAGGPDINKYFNLPKEVMQPSRAVLAVYFKQADICIVTRNNFAAAAELNPQLRKELAVIWESRPFAAGIVAISKDYGHRNLEIIKGILETLHQDIQGQQLLTIFHKNKLVPYRPGNLTSTKIVLNEYKELNAGISKR
jgi:ABC-type phosphate/phosphonate transport system substrate-binding protein